jgi:hypothetical protein
MVKALWRAVQGEEPWAIGTCAFQEEGFFRTTIDGHAYISQSSQL